jgi:uncharacterized protein (TIRG00374 family)
LRRWAQVAFVVVALGLAYLFLAHSKLDWRELWARVREASWPVLAAGIALLLARFALWDWRFRLAAEKALGERPGAVLGFFVFLASAALNLVTPTVRLVGGLLRARYFARATDRSFGFLYGVVFYDQVAHTVMMTLCTWTTVAAAALALGRHWLGLGLLVTLAAASVGVVVWLRRSGRSGGASLAAFFVRRIERAERTGGPWRRLLAHGHEAVGVFLRLLAERRLALQAAALGLAFYLVNAAAQWVLFLAMGEWVPPLAVLTVVALGTTAGTLTATPGGLGTTEVTMLVFFKLMGVDEVLAAAGVLLFRGLHYACVLALGLPAIAVLEWRPHSSSRISRGNNGWPATAVTNPNNANASTTTTTKTVTSAYQAESSKLSG